MAVEYSVGGLGIDIKLNGVEAALSQIDQLQKQLGAKAGGKGKSGGVGGKGSKVAKSVGIFTTLGRFSYYINMMRYYGKFIGTAVQQAVDFNETLNLWQVSMRGNIGLAEEFISKLSKAYGLSQETLMRYQAVFKNMLSALGDLEDSVSTKLSELLLARAVDFASLYNITNERAFTMFQAVLSGQVRPIRSVSGYDITEKTIFDIYQQAGGNKTVRGLSQIEKRLLRIYAVFNQMEKTGAVGDWAKQIEEPANQLRILGEQMKELGQWFGQFFLTIMEPILPKLNAFVITLKEIVKSLNYAMGFMDKDHLEGFEASFVDANEAVEELQGNLFSFDKFDVAGGGSTGNFFGIDPTVQGLLDGMDTSIRDINMQANQLADTWLTRLGFIWSEEDSRWLITEESQKFIETLKLAGIALGILTGGVLLQGVKKLGLALLGIGKDATLANVGVSLLTTTLTIGLIYGIVWLIKEWNNLTDMMKGVGVAIVTLTGIALGAMLLVKAGFISLSTAFIATGIGAIIVAVALLVYTVVVYWEELVSFFKKNWQGILLFIINPFVGAFKLLYDNVEGFKSFIDNTLKAIGGFFTNLWKGVANGFASMINGIANGFIIFINVFIEAINTATRAVSKLWTWTGLKGIPEIPSWSATVNWQPYAEGGFPPTGQVFIAREAGPEMVGNIGGRTAVANNDQIVDGIASGVGQEVAPLVTITRAIYNVIKNKDTQSKRVDYQVLANNLTPYIEGNLARKGVKL